MIEWLQLHQAGHFRNMPAHHGVRSRPLDHLLFWVISGKGWVRFRGTKQRMSAGHLILLPPGEPHEYGADPADPWDEVWVHFGGPAARWFARQISPPRDWCSRLGMDDLVLQRWDEMVIAAEDPRRRGGLLPSALLIGLLALIIDRRQPQTVPARRAAPFDVDRLQLYIHRHLATGIKLEDLARQAGLSPAYFSRSFRRVFAVPPSQYLARQRVARAAVLLKNTSMKLSEIARAVGYDDPYYLSRVFKKTTGRPPSAHRPGRNRRRRSA